ncbi:GCD1 Nucleoside-diphosphate-sugar pyrophosphorylase involved in lipopolysaccharide biosynthesis/translation initiation factor 2B, gamma/epsilon subunits (eIF-2Bgamma/eIF-2Bepsilon) [Candidatus Nanopelagicaceae bacterium]
MKVVILAGGLGTRLSEYTHLIPKPMVRVGEKPLIWHIMQRYAMYGFSDFVVALGYKGHVVKDYFLSYRQLNSDFVINLGDGRFEVLQEEEIDWNISLVDTGRDTMTGGRLKRLEKLLGGERFMLTYGDGVSDINISELLDFHLAHGKMVTMTAVHPAARFGELELDGSRATAFLEKPQMNSGWINGGYFVIEPEFLKYIKDDSTLLEREPLESIARIGELMAFKHEKFWQCVDTKRDLELLQKLWESNPSWIK